MIKSSPVIAAVAKHGWLENPQTKWSCYWKNTEKSSNYINRIFQHAMFEYPRVVKCWLFFVGWFFHTAQHGWRHLVGSKFVVLEPVKRGWLENLQATRRLLAGKIIKLYFLGSCQCHVWLPESKWNHLQKLFWSMAVSRWKMLQIFFPQVCFNCFTMFRTSAAHLTFHVKELERLHRIIHCLGRSAVSPSSHMSHPIPIPWLNPKCKKNNK